RTTATEYAGLGSTQCAHCVAQLAPRAHGPLGVRQRRTREAHSTWMVCAPAAFPIARSGALSPITTDSSGETPRRLMAYCARSGAGFGRGAESPPRYTSMSCLI